jgi:1-pyrroline-5-carboxylate dehydrogenase
MDAVTRVPPPYNEPVRQYQPGSADRAALESKIKELAGQQAELTMTIGGRPVMGSGERVPVVQPHNFRRVLGEFGNATDEDVLAAIAAAGAAARGWRTFARQLLSEQPESAPGTWNRLEYRPLEGFVLAITPFNFTSIAGNLPTAPALLGNVVVWKPSPTQQLAAHYIMRLLEAAGLPPGVINMVTGDGQAVSRVALSHPDLAGIHFTGSTATFQHLWRTVGEHIGHYRGYPRLVGETGGKDFVVAHPSVDEAILATTLIRGSFEYQGQKCSAASRAYLPRSLWDQVRGELVTTTQSLSFGDVSEDLSLFGGAVIDSRAVDKHRAAFERARSRPAVRFLTGGEIDDSAGYFVRPSTRPCSARPPTPPRTR